MAFFVLKVWHYSTFGVNFYFWALDQLTGSIQIFETLFIWAARISMLGPYFFYWFIAALLFKGAYYEDTLEQEAVSFALQYLLIALISTYVQLKLEPKIMDAYYGRLDTEEDPEPDTDADED